MRILRRQCRFFFFQLRKLFLQIALALLVLAACLLESSEFSGAFIQFCLQRLRFAIHRTDVLLVLRNKRRFLFLQLRQLFFQLAQVLRAFVARVFERHQFIGTLIQFIAQRLHIAIKTRGVLGVALCDSGLFGLKTRYLLLQ